MSILELSFASGEDSLGVRRFSVHEPMSGLFSVSIWARSTNDDIDLETIVGQDATFRAMSGMAHASYAEPRRWSGVVSHMDLIHAEPTGLSTYHLRIVPRMWLMTQRTNNRLFQHRSVPDIVDQILGDWHLERAWRIDRSCYPKLELRVQYGETDYDFLNRLLEEVGISYFFRDDPERGNHLVLADAPQSVEPREGGPLTYADNPNQSSEREFVTGLRIAQQVRPGKVTLRDFDFRRAPRLQLLGGSTLGKGVEDLLEVYRYEPGGFLVELEEAAQDRLKDLAGQVAAMTPLPDLAAGAGQALTTVKKTAAAAAAATDAAPAPGEKSAAEKAKEKAQSFAESKVEGFVEKKVGALVEDKLKGAAGEKAAHLVGGIAGAVAGDISGAIAGFVAGEVAGKLGGKLGGLLGKLVGDDKGKARFSEKEGQLRAARQLESARASRRSVTFETNAMDLAPGMVMTIGNHARSDVGADKKLLVTEFSIEGTNDGEWSMAASAAFADLPYRPPQCTPKPSIQGLQSAVIVGPPGEEIHTDEHGRVRVQFHWDREGGFDEGSSCWMRVSQGWAGSGYGMITIPRVGQEVLVAFLEGNPDHPVVVGRLYNATSPVPYDLPEHKTRSGWRTSSSPGSTGFNELMFEDARGRELVYLQAERDYDRVVKRNEAVSVGVDRRTSIGSVDESMIGARYNRTMRPAQGSDGQGDGKGTGPTFFEMVDKRIHLSTGEASITLDGPNITLEAKGRIFIHSTDDDVELLGGPWVKINCDPPKEGESDTVTMHHITGIVRDQDGKPLPNYTVVVKASDGSVQQVRTDSAGRYFALVPPGKCQVSLADKLRFGSPGAKVDDMTFEAETFDDCGPAV